MLIVFSINRKDYESGKVCSAYRKEVPSFGTSVDKTMAFHRNPFRENALPQNAKAGQRTVSICVNQCQKNLCALGVLCGKK